MFFTCSPKKAASYYLFGKEMRSKNTRSNHSLQAVFICVAETSDKAVTVQVIYECIVGAKVRLVCCFVTLLREKKYLSPQSRGQDKFLFNYDKSLSLRA